jgi:hypothetical protein
MGLAYKSLKIGAKRGFSMGRDALIVDSLNQSLYVD